MVQNVFKLSHYLFCTKSTSTFFKHIFSMGGYLNFSFIAVVVIEPFSLNVLLKMLTENLLLSAAIRPNLFP